jgi:hypothetical protein
VVQCIQFEVSSDSRDDEAGVTPATCLPSLSWWGWVVDATSFLVEHHPENSL